ncbi:MAG: disulfide bond formation protein B [Pseudomonadota bacterium]
MALTAQATKQGPAYKGGGLILVASLGILATVFAYEHLGGYAPCPLCLQQRYAFYAAVPLCFAALFALSMDASRLATLILLAVAFIFLANVALAGYHAGIEWGYWPGPASCGSAQTLDFNAKTLVQSMQQTNVIRCNEAAGRFLGLSFAGWNVIASFILFVIGLKSANAAAKEH